MIIEARLFIIVFGLFAAGQGFLLTTLLVAKRKNHDANMILAALIATFSITISYSIYIMSETFREYPMLIGVIEPFPLLFGPLWYLYSLTLTTHQKLSMESVIPHFIPFMCGYIIIAPFLMMGGESKIAMIENIHDILHLMFLAANILMLMHGIVYLTLSTIHLKKYFKRILNFFSTIENIHLHWLRVMTILIFCILIVVAFFMLFGLFGISFMESINPIVGMAISIIIFTASYKGLRQNEILEPLFIIPTPATDSLVSYLIPVDLKNNRSYKRSSLSEEKKSKIMIDLQRLLEQEKPFLKCDLTLEDLARRLSVSEHNLSESINTVMKKTFYDLINEYRVQEFQLRLVDPQNKHFTLTAIAYDSGFNSKSTFNSIFKKYVGITPSAYRAQKVT